MAKFAILFLYFTALTTLYGVAKKIQYKACEVFDVGSLVTPKDSQ